MDFTIEQDQESDGRWMAEVLELPSVLAYGATSLEAVRLFFFMSSLALPRHAAIPLLFSS